MERKSINIKTAIKGLINGFIAYGILLIFVFLSIVIFVSWQFNQYKEYTNSDALKFLLPALAAILLFFIIRFICRLSTFDLFKKCKIKKEEVESVASKMNLFFIGCVIFSVILILVILTVRFNNEKVNIQNTADLYYSEYSESFAEYLTVEMISEFQISRATTLIQTIIIEMGLLLGLFSLIPLQKNFIERYNYIEDEEQQK